MKKRIISFILAVALMISLMPATTIPAFAAAGAISVNGGDIYADGNAIILQAGTNSDYTNIFIDSDVDGILDTDEAAPINLNGVSLFNGTLTGDTTTGFDLSEKYVYGGSKNSSITGNTKITMLGGKVDIICGGGSGTGADITGNTYLTLSGGTIRFVRGGGVDSFVSGSTNILINGATFDSGGYTWVFGGGDGPNGTVGTANVNIKAGSSFDLAQIYGGGEAITAQYLTVQT